MQNVLVTFLQECWVWQWIYAVIAVLWTWQVSVPGDLEVEEPANYGGQKNEFELFDAGDKHTTHTHTKKKREAMDIYSTQNTLETGSDYQTAFCWVSFLSLTLAHPWRQSQIQNSCWPLVYLLLRFLILEHSQLWRRIQIIPIKLCINGGHFPIELREVGRHLTFFIILSLLQ